MWIRDSLPKSYPRVRALLYGYDTKLLNSDSFQRVEDISTTLTHQLCTLSRSSGSKRPMVFLAHSLGGIVLKQALVSLAYSGDPTQSMIFESILGGIFYGVPNLGMKTSHLVAMAEGRSNTHLLEQLQENAQYLDKIEAEFETLSRTGGKLSRKLFFWCYETKESIIPIQSPNDGKWSSNVPGAPRLKLVERESATRGFWRTPGKKHLTFAINRDHSNMVKYESIHDPTLIDITSILGQILEPPLQADRSLRLELTEDPSPPRPSLRFDRTDLPAVQPVQDVYNQQLHPWRLPSESQNIPDLRPLIGREAELDEISILLKPAQSGKHVATIRGPPGIGKTQLVARFAKDSRDIYTNVFYLNGQDPCIFRESVRSEVNRIGERWSSRLLGLLSAERVHMANLDQLCTFLNQKANDKWLLVIDQLYQFELVAGLIQRLHQGFIVLVSTSSQVGKQFPSITLSSLSLNSSIQLLVESSPSQGLVITSEHHRLLAVLGYHPALIHTAAQDIHELATETSMIKIWSCQETQLPDWLRMSIESILSAEFSDNQFSTEARESLLLCTLLDQEELTYKLLEFLDIPNLSELFDFILPRLMKHGLVEAKTYSKSTGFSISKVFIRFLRNGCNMSELVAKASELLAKKSPRRSKDDYRKATKLLAPHAKAFSSYIRNHTYLSRFENSTLGNLERIASILRLDENYEAAFMLYNYVHLHDDIPQDLRRLRKDAIIYTRSTDVTVLSRRAELYNNMGLCSFHDGGVSFAQSCFVRASGCLEDCKLSRNPDVIQGLNTPLGSYRILEIASNKAWAHIEMEEYQKVGQLLDETINFFGEDSHNASSPTVTSILKELRGLTIPNPQAETTDQTLENIMNIEEDFREALLGLKHALGFRLAQLGYSEIGVQVLEQCREAAATSRQASKRLRYSIMHDLATAYVSQKRWEHAVALYEKTREGRIEYHGPRHRYTIETIAALAFAYSGNNQPNEATALFKEALEWQCENLRENHPATLRTLHNYGIFRHDTGEPEVAEKALQLAHRGFTILDDENRTLSWRRINAGVSLALVLQDIGLYQKDQKALRLFDEAIKWYKEKSTDSRPMTIQQYVKVLCLHGKMCENLWLYRLASASYKDALSSLGRTEVKANYWVQMAEQGRDRISGYTYTKRPRALLLSRERHRRKIA
ncbi:hypothetical protein F4775DRAFT_574145 [Biscogniauxia sp. FL1348]|nr:hypothetical protein F4775DRAFT_574145 [Biscogniauxia sp. FL1348]